MGRGENDEKTKIDNEEVEGGFCDKFRGFPKCIGFIVGNEFCERFSFYGMKAILTIYLLEALLFDDSTSTAIYHAFTFGCYFTPILGAIMADSWLGKTIVSVSVVYCLGHLIMSLSDLVGPEPYPFRGPSPSGKMTIVSVSILYAIGNFVLSISSLFGAPPYPFYGVSPDSNMVTTGSVLLLTTMDYPGLEPGQT
ncbi:hypothetical protein Bbelb_259380 [Branchiostoma belcheri]|nr:hypothetical protein Bbelb_259380 [Branchiostoma belcheri]